MWTYLFGGHYSTHYNIFPGYLGNYTGQIFISSYIKYEDMAYAVWLDAVALLTPKHDFAIYLYYEVYHIENNEIFKRLKNTWL